MKKKEKKWRDLGPRVREDVIYSALGEYVERYDANPDYYKPHEAVRAERYRLAIRALREAVR